MRDGLPTKYLLAAKLAQALTKMQEVESRPLVSGDDDDDEDNNDNDTIESSG